MFIGHFAVGFASKKLVPGVSLAWLMVAPVLLDVLWPVFILLGWEQARIEPGITAVSPFDFIYYPISHSLIMSMVWAGLFGGAYAWLHKDRKAAMVLGLGVLSHWVLDFVSHKPDMPVGWHGPYVGLELWASTTATLLVEGTMFASAIWLYTALTRSKNRIGSLVLWITVGILVAGYLQSMFGPPPPSIEAVAVSGILALVVFTPLFWWFDHNREVR